MVSFNFSKGKFNFQMTSVINHNKLTEEIPFKTSNRKSWDF